MRVCAPAPCTLGRDDVRLREIEHRRAERQQADPARDAEQIGRANELGQRREGAAADARSLARAGLLRHGRGAFEPVRRRTPPASSSSDATISRLAGPSGTESPIVMHRPEQRARGAAGADEAEQALALLAVKRSAMNDQNTATANRLNTLTQTKNTRATATGVDVERQQQPEQREIGDEEMVDDGMKRRARQLAPPARRRAAARRAA